MTKSRLDHALELAGKGFAVFPCRYNENRPAIAGWQDASTTEPEAVSAWFKGSARNIGIDTEKSGLFVVDLDMKTGNGIDELKALANGRPIPKTLMATTPSGGKHLYYRGKSKSSVKLLAANIDIRSAGGLVAAPGSVRDGKPYEWVNAEPIAEAPQWLLDLAGAPVPKRDFTWSTSLDEIDTPSQIALATAYLKGEEGASEGSGGDAFTLKVCNRVLDYGVSLPTALDLMLEHWNERCSPPWSVEELEQKLENAARYRNTPIGCASPEADFDVLVAPVSTFDAMTPARRFNAKAIPKRQWVLGKYLLCSYVTILVAAPGAGKSTLAIQMALAVITGRKDITGFEVHKRGAVVLVNNEDDVEEMQRRLAACMAHFKVSWEDIDGKLFLKGASNDPWRIAVRKGKGPYTELRATLEPTDVAAMRAAGVVLFIADPFLETHEANENDNREINLVGQLYRGFAKDAEIAVLIVHHTRKLGGSDRSENAGGNIESARGASSLIGVARVGLTLHQMTERDAKFYGVTEKASKGYVRLDHAKANLSKMAPDALWYEKTEVILPNGDDVGVLVPTTMVSAERREAETMAECFIKGFTEAGDRIVSVNKAAGWVAEDPLFSGSSRSTISKRIKELFAEPVTRMGWTFEVEEREAGDKTLFDLVATDDISLSK